MTDEERQKLCAALRNTSDDWLPERLRTDVRDIAADEIERLAKELLITEGALEKCQGELNLAFDRMQRHD
jgi:ribosome recycling factor